LHWRECPKLYTKTTERLGLYVRTQFKNGLDVENGLMQKKLVKSSLPEIAQRHAAHEKRVW